MFVQSPPLAGSSTLRHLGLRQCAALDQYIQPDNLKNQIINNFCQPSAKYHFRDQLNVIASPGLGYPPVRGAISGLGMDGIGYLRVGWGIEHLTVLITHVGARLLDVLTPLFNPSFILQIIQEKSRLADGFNLLCGVPWLVWPVKLVSSIRKQPIRNGSSVSRDNIL